MTREEAIRRLTNMERRIGIHTEQDKRDYSALEMAISALEHESKEVKELSKDLDEALAELQSYEHLPCEDAISREAVLDALLDYWHDIQFVDGTGYDVFEDSAEVIKALPSVTPCRRKGYWEDIPFSKYFKCSECGCYQISNTEFCPKCGAEMESEE